MKFLIIGLGSMGKRRIRNLIALRNHAVEGFDLRADRRLEAEQKYKIRTYLSFEQAIQNRFDALIISVPPDKHHIYMKEALKLRIPFFVEASVIDDDLEIIKREANELNLLAAPSSTMFFHPAIRLIDTLINKGIVGTISSIQYHSGQYLPDWHTYEEVSNFYVSNKETGGAREIVPFELTWLVAIFGFPVSVTGLYKKTINIQGAENIDDSYWGLFDYERFVLNLTIDVVSRCATRQLMINGSKGQMKWDWNNHFLNVYTAEKGWEEFPFELMRAEEGYNKNITEQMYVDEMACFIGALEGNQRFVNDLEKDHNVLMLLYALEESNDTHQTIFIK
ncbi:MAG: Gfo/Idh/MocA family oxidoreductase [Cytophagales bacterium]